MSKYRCITHHEHRLYKLYTQLKAGKKNI